MTSAPFRALLFLSWTVPAAAALAIALQASLAWLAPGYGYLVLLAVLFVVGVLPWLLLAYVAASKRFGIGWHWAVAAVASLLVVECSRISLAGVFDIRVVTEMIRSACSVRVDAPITQLQGRAVSCALASWSSLTTAALVRAVTAGMLLVAVAWLYAKYVRSRSKQ